VNLALRRHRWLVRIGTWFYWMLLVTATHLPPNHMPQTHVNDKVEHFTAYSLLCAALFLCLWPSRLSTRTIAGILLTAGLAFGAVDELTQPRFGRDCDIHDWYADAAGTATAVAIMTTLAHSKRRAAQVTNLAPAQSA
jgi:VanZ family protein